MGYQNYNVAGDVITIAICVLYRIMLRTTYTIKYKNLTIFKMGNALILLAAFSHILFDRALGVLSAELIPVVYILRDTSYISIVLTYALFCIYVRNLVAVESWIKRLLDVLVWGSFALFSIAEILAPWTKWGFYITESLTVHQDYHRGPFYFIYAFYGLLILVMFLAYRRKLTAKMFYCILSSMVIAVLLMVAQSVFRQSTFTNVTFTFPVMVVLFLFHYNSYDAQTGTLDARSFNGYIKDMGRKRFSMVCLYLQGLNEGRLQEISHYVFHFSENYFKKPCIFRMKDDRLVLVYEDERNKNIEERFPLLLEEFYKLYARYKMDYRVVIIHGNEKLSTGEEYLGLNEFIDGKIALNSVHLCEQKDVDDFLEHRYILGELRDIHLRKDLDDERVKVYCQPVFNARTHQYVSAEALIRLDLLQCGRILPERFIPISEKCGYIHTFSQIILNKVCKQIRHFAENGYMIDHISINFPITELRDQNFCEDILRIIQQNRIPYDKIAFELTESRNESDFEKVGDVMERLHHLGIKFYLDDFGTGYSNFVRIIGLPIDIIKFDRSLTLLACKDEESKFLVGRLADIFRQSNYQVVFKGIEDEDEERCCLDMSILYLQGYKYSRPVPIEELKGFLDKVG